MGPTVLPEKFLHELRRLLKKLGVPPAAEDWFRSALAHRSWINEYSEEAKAEGLHSNERLEFLGDAVLGLVMAGLLYELQPGQDEGQLSKAKAHLVSAEVLAEQARRLGLGELLLLGRGEELTGGRKRPSLLANALEAVIGAWFLAEGLEPVKQFVRQGWAEAIAAASSQPGNQDYKSLLQELAQKRKGELPVYRIEKTAGPEHSKVYEISVAIAGRSYGRGQGRSKKEAAQTAAAAALAALQAEKPKSGGDA